MRTRPVFESYSAFVNHLYSAVNEEASAAPAGGNIDSLNKLIAGNCLPEGSYRKQFATLIQYMNGYMTEGAADQIKDAAENVSNFLTLDGYGITTKGVFRVDSNIGTYKYLSDGYVTVTGAPTVNKNTGKISTGSIDTGRQVMALRDLLRGIFAYNLQLWAECFYSIDSEDKKKQVSKFIKDYALGGSESKREKLESGKKPLYIQIESLKKEAIAVLEFDGSQKDVYGYNYGGFLVRTGDGNVAQLTMGLPTYYIAAKEDGSPLITPNGGELVGTDSYTDVIEPAGASKPVEDLYFSSSDYGDGDAELGKGFFADNDTKISDAGMREIRSLISKFNKITSIEVTGSASNLPTKREGGNQKLAEDRRSAGIAALESIADNEKPKQLEGADIKEGTATVQPSGETADPKKRNVTFKISGELKTAEGDTTQGEGGKEQAKPIYITKISEKKNDSVTLASGLLLIGINVAKK